MAERYPIVFMYHSFFVRSIVDGHLGCFHILAVVNSDAVFAVSIFLGLRDGNEDQIWKVWWDLKRQDC